MIALIDYDAGNTCSVMNALDRLGTQYILTADSSQIKSADKVIFPGVGHAGAAMQALKKKGLVEVIRTLTQPVLGVCVGMQLLGEHSEEGDTLCLGLIPGKVKRFQEANGIKVPHMGWNQIAHKREDHLMMGIQEGSHVYFVHSYYMTEGDYMIASCHYQSDFAAAVRKDNFWGVQFHPEKSGAVGSLIIENFLSE